MNFTIDDIEIFITTHNRADYLVQSIESILNQTAGVKHLTILDNESTDNTEEIVKSFEDRGVKYIKTFGFLGNFNKAQEIASKKYVVLLHDDDISHPQYLELAIKALNSYENISMVATRYTEFKNNELPQISKNLSFDHYLFKTQKAFATHMYFIEHIAYATAIYRTEDFKKTPLEYEKYNKFNDWPLMVKMSKYGRTVLLDDPNFYYARRHDGQDTWTNTNIPTIQQIINWDKCFYEAIKPHEPFALQTYLFRKKCKAFMVGKYVSFVPNDGSKRYQNSDLCKLAKKAGINLHGAKLISRLFNPNMISLSYLECIWIEKVKRRFLQKFKSNLYKVSLRK